METYLKEISKYSILSPEEEKELWERYKGKDDIDARQELIKSFQPLVLKMVKQMNANQENMMDLIQEGNIGLIDAVDTFDHQRGTRFTTFAYYHIRGRMIDFFNKGISLTVYNGEISAAFPDEMIENNFAIDKIKSTLKDLPDKERNVIEGMYLSDKKAELLAAEMNISLSYLYRLQKKAIRRLRGKLTSFIKHWK